MWVSTSKVHITAAIDYVCLSMEYVHSSTVKRCDNNALAKSPLCIYTGYSVELLNLSKSAVNTPKFYLIEALVVFYT